MMNENAAKTESSGITNGSFQYRYPPEERRLAYVSHYVQKHHFVNNEKRFIGLAQTHSQGVLSTLDQLVDDFWADVTTL